MKMKKTIAILLALVLMVSLVACGGKDSDKGGKKEEVKGSQQSWGMISVFVPEGYVLNGGSITGIDDTDETQCSIQPEQATMYDYFWIAVKDADFAASSIETTKDVNSAEDITITAGDKDWTGCHYVYDSYSGSVDCGAVSCEIDGATYLVTFCGHAPDSAEMTAVLSSISAAK